MPSASCLSTMIKIAADCCQDAAKNGAAEPQAKRGPRRSTTPKGNHMKNITNIAEAKGPFAFIKEGRVRLNPAQANKIFNDLRYEFNRSTDRAKQHISALARMMKSGDWRDGGVIEFARFPDGSLTMLDGHHRMLAQVEAGVDVIWNIAIHDVADEDEFRNLFWTYDTTLRVRTRSNILDGVRAAENFGLGKQTTEKLTRASQFIDNGMNANVGMLARRYTPGEQLTLASEWVAEAGTYERITAGVPQSLRRKLGSAQVMAVALVTLRAKPQEAEEFWAGIAADDGLRKGDPRKTLLDWLRDTHLAGTGLRSAAAAVARAWQAWVGGKQLNFIRVGRTPVQIAGTKIVVRP